METKEIRRNNLRELMARYARQGVNQNEFATLVESSAPTLSQIIGEKSSRNLGDNLARRIEARLNLPKGWFDVFHEKQLVRPFDNVAAESDFQPARLKPVVWEDTEQDKEEFVEIPLLDIDFSAGDGCYEIVDREEFSLIFRRYYLHKMGWRSTPHASFASPVPAWNHGCRTATWSASTPTTHASGKARPTPSATAICCG